MDFMTLYRQRKSDQEIAQALGIKKCSVKKRRHRLGLKSNVPQGRPRKIEPAHSLSYKLALPREKWDEMRFFLRVMTTVRRYGGDRKAISRVIDEWHKRGGLS